MRDNELELIAALVEGRLEDETEARALIASSPEFREEYESQKLAYEALQGAASVELTESERSALHRDVWTALRREKTVAGSSPWYYRWIPVTAAALLVLVGLVAVLGQVGGQDSAFDEIAADLADGGGENTAETTDSDSAGADEAGDDGAETFEESTESTAAASESLPDDPARYYAQEAERVREGEFTGRMQTYDTESDRDVSGCLERADLAEYLAVAILTPPDQVSQESVGEPLVVVAVPEGSELSDAIVAFVDLSSCQVVYLDD